MELARRRLALILLCASLAIVYSAAAKLTPWSDFAQTHEAARALLAGQSPYQHVGPGRAFPYEFPYLYPITAPLSVLPVALLPLELAEGLMAGLSAGLLVWLFTRERLADPRLTVCASLALFHCLQNVQWSALLTVASQVPSLGFLLTAKPTMGLALFLAYPSTRTALLGASLAGLTVILWPAWIGEWLAGLPAAPHIRSPVLYPGGFLLLAAAIRWRLPAGRLLLAVSLLPQNLSLYELVPLFLLVRRVEEGAALCGLLVLASGWSQYRVVGVTDTLTMYQLTGEVIVWTVLLPCVAWIVWRDWRRESAEVRPSAEVVDSIFPAAFLEWLIIMGKDLKTLSDEELRALWETWQTWIAPR